jgi:hypothetical protein
LTPRVRRLKIVKASTLQTRWYEPVIVFENRISTPPIRDSDQLGPPRLSVISGRVALRDWMVLMVMDVPRILCGCSPYICGCSPYIMCSRMWG